MLISLVYRLLFTVLLSFKLEGFITDFHFIVIYFYTSQFRMLSRETSHWAHLSCIRFEHLRVVQGVHEYIFDCEN